MNVYSNRLLDGRFKLRHLRLVLAIAENGTVAGAARELYITQPVVTRGLREAEEILGVQLFVRGPRGVAPTVSGDLLIDHARVVLSTLLRLDERINDTKSSGTRPVRVGVNMTGSTVVLPRALVKLKQSNPAIKVSVFEGTDENLTTRLRHNDIDLLVGRPSEGEHDGLDMDNVESMSLFEESIEVMVRQGHPLLECEKIRIDDLVEYPWVLPPPPTAIGDAVASKFLAAGHHPPRNLLESNSMPVSLSVVTTTDAVAPLPASLLRADSRLVVLPIDLDTVPRQVGVTFLASGLLSDSAKLLVTCLEAVAAELAAADDLDDRPTPPSPPGIAPRA